MYCGKWFPWKYEVVRYRDRMWLCGRGHGDGFSIAWCFKVRGDRRGVVRPVRSCCAVSLCGSGRGGLARDPGLSLFGVARGLRFGSVRAGAGARLICSGALCGFFRLRVPTRWCGACNFVVCAFNAHVAFLWPTCVVQHCALPPFYAVEEAKQTLSIRAPPAASRHHSRSGPPAPLPRSTPRRRHLPRRRRSGSTARPARGHQQCSRAFH